MFGGVFVMKKIVISVLGKDRPGIIATVTRVLYENDCNIENVSQTILQSEFSGIFIAEIPDELTVEQMDNSISEALKPLFLHGYVKELEEEGPGFDAKNCESFIITTKGPDRKGLVARITKVIADFGVNVANLQAIFKGGDDPDQNIMIYEVDIPPSTDQKSLREALRKKAGELDLEINIQHRNIFDAINRI